MALSPEAKALGEIRTKTSPPTLQEMLECQWKSMSILDECYKRIWRNRVDVYGSNIHECKINKYLQSLAAAAKDGAK